MSLLALSAWLFMDRFFCAWIWINLIVSLLHYAYDGMIWKREQKPLAAP